MKHRAPVIIVPYTEQWTHMFRAESSLLLALLPRHFILEHVGSTSVPDMPSKPIIDMMLGASALSEIEAAIPVLAGLGYEYMPQHEAEIPERRFFAKPLERPRTFHLHGVVYAGKFWTEHLAFRNRLKSDKKLAAEYASLKRRLASAHGDDRAAYTSAKSNFIQQAVHGASAA